MSEDKLLMHESQWIYIPDNSFQYHFICLHLKHFYCNNLVSLNSKRHITVHPPFAQHVCNQRKQILWYPKAKMITHWPLDQWNWMLFLSFEQLFLPILFPRIDEREIAQEEGTEHKRRSSFGRWWMHAEVHLVHWKRLCLQDLK